MISRRRFLKMAGGTAAAGLVASYPFFIERYVVFVNTYRVPVPRLPSAFDGLRIVHLTDLHLGPLTPKSMIASVVRRANAIEGDLIVCTGDYVRERNARVQVDTVWPIMAELRAPLGVYSVLGNHDHWADTERSVYWLQETGQDLRHKTKLFERGDGKLWLMGTGDLWEDHQDLDLALSAIPESECRIALAHNPDTADSEFGGRVDLFLSGHTHGGQVNLPFLGAPILPVQNKDYDHGLKQSRRGVPVFISRGIGWSMFPVRFNCAPEIAVLELVSG